MKILYITKEPKPDYQCDMIFHGLYSKDDVEVIESTRMSHMFTDYPSKEKLYGRGFTVYCNLTDKQYDRTNIGDKIRDKYFDCVIYGSIHRCQDYLDLVLQVYNKNQIMFIDGEDRTYYKTDVLGKGLYFKRELVSPLVDVFPIQFCIPKEKIYTNGYPLKLKHCATVLPGNKKTYIFSQELEYYKDYQYSKFAWTRKKGGWDCLRHYEIIANKCLPFFLDIEGCPKETMFKWPKSLSRKINEAYRSHDFTSSTYDGMIHEMDDALLNNLTTEKMTDYLLSYLK